MTYSFLIDDKSNIVRLRSVIVFGENQPTILMRQICLANILNNGYKNFSIKK